MHSTHHSPKQLSSAERDDLLGTLQSRFDAHPARHADLAWAEVRKRLEENPAALQSLAAMERTGGEPDVVGREGKTGALLFMDCAPESPKGRRSVCYDQAARKGRKEHAPETSALEMAAAMGIELLTEEQYRMLQTRGAFDTKTSSWIQTPPAIRALGGALFCDRRYDSVFTYHNGVDSYYGARGWRGVVGV